MDVQKRNPVNHPTTSCMVEDWKQTFWSVDNGQGRDTGLILTYGTLPKRRRRRSRGGGHGAVATRYHGTPPCSFAVTVCTGERVAQPRHNLSALSVSAESPLLSHPRCDRSHPSVTQADPDGTQSQPQTQCDQAGTAETHVLLPRVRVTVARRLDLRRDGLGQEWGGCESWQPKPQPKLSSRRIDATVE